MINVLSNAAITIHDSQFFEEVQEQNLKEDIKSNIKELYSDETIIKGIQAQNMLILKYIYKKFFHQVRFMVTSNSGRQMDAEDVFQDAMVIIYQKISSGKLDLSCSFSTYLYAICKNIWLQKLNKHGIQCEYKDSMELNLTDDSHNLEALIEDNEKFILFQKHFQKLTEDDQKVMRLFLKKVPLAEIALIMGYKSYEYAKVRKYIIKEKLKNSILNDPRYREIFQAGEISVVISS
jgi:RNA polymerase sigma factor (sigma-70 family)